MPTPWECLGGSSLSTKLKVYLAVVLTSLLYLSETWTVHSRHAKQLNRFHLSCLGRLFHIIWQDKIPDSKVIEHPQRSHHSTESPGWIDEQAMSDIQLPKQLLYGEPVRESARLEGKRNVSVTSSKSPSKTWTSTPVLGIRLTSILKL